MPSVDEQLADVRRLRVKDAPAGLGYVAAVPAARHADTNEIVDQARRAAEVLVAEATALPDSANEALRTGDYARYNELRAREAALPAQLRAAFVEALQAEAAHLDGERDRLGDACHPFVVAADQLRTLIAELRDELIEVEMAVGAGNAARDQLTAAVGDARRTIAALTRAARPRPVKAWSDPPEIHDPVGDMVALIRGAIR